MNNENSNAFEQIHAVINDPNTPQEIADSLRADISAKVVNGVTSDNFDWSDRRVICALWPLVRALDALAVGLRLLKIY